MFSEIISIAFGELEVSNSTIIIMCVLTAITFIGVGISSIKLLNFGSEDDNIDNWYQQCIYEVIKKMKMLTSGMRCKVCGCEITGLNESVLVKKIINGKCEKCDDYRSSVTKSYKTHIVVRSMILIFVVAIVIVIILF